MRLLIRFAKILPVQRIEATADDDGAADDGDAVGDVAEADETDRRRKQHERVGVGLQQRRRCCAQGQDQDPVGAAAKDADPNQY